MTQSIDKLLDLGVISEEQRSRAQLLLEKHGGTLGLHLISISAISEEQLLYFIAGEHRIQVWERSRLLSLPAGAICTFDAERVYSLRLLPLKQESNTLFMATTDPGRYDAFEKAYRHCGHELRLVLVAESDMSWALHNYYGAIPIKLQSRAPRSPVATTPVINVATIRTLEARKKEKISQLAANGQRESTSPSDRAAKQALLSGTGWKIDLDGSAHSEDDAAAIGIWQAPAMASGSSADSSGPIPMNSARPESSGDGVGVGNWFELPSAGHTKETTEDAELTVTRGNTPSTTPDQILSAGRPSAQPASSKLPPPSMPASVTEFSEEDGIVRRTITSIPPAPPAPPAPRSMADTVPPPQRNRASRPTQAPPPPVLLEAIAQAKNRDALVHHALEYMTHFAGRSIFFAVTHSQIKGHDAIGEGTSPEAVKTLRLPLSSPSTLSTAVEGKAMRTAVLGTDTADAILAASLGCRGEQIFLAPILIGQHTVGLIFADQLPEKPIPLDAIATLTGQVGLALKALVKKS